MSEESCTFETLLPRAISCTIESNPHKVVYESVEQYLSGGGNVDFESPGQRQRAIHHDTLWVMQWYPRTPVGFHEIGAPTLPELLNYAKRVAEASDA